MRVFLAMFFSAIMLSSCQSLGSAGYEPDRLISSQAHWRPGQVIANGEVDWEGLIGKHNFYRKFIGFTDQGYAVVQDFYAGSGNKFTDPYVVMQPDRIGDIGLVMEDMDTIGSTLLDGELTLWYENGQKESERHYQDGIEQGLWTWWYENGQKAAESQYQDGKVQGIFTLWFENGQKKGEGNYQEDEQDGLWTWWDENGKKSIEVLFKAGEVVSETMF